MSPQKFRPYLVGIALVLFAYWMGVPGVSQAQPAEYRLNVKRNFGFGSGSQIRGNFTLSVIGDEPIHSVTYFINGQVMGEVTTAPFDLVFRTTDFPVGWYALSAEVRASSGRVAITPARRFEFVSAEVELTAVQNIIFPLLGGTFLLLIVMFGGQILLLRKKRFVQLPAGAARKYGAAGGAICPRCQRPYALHWWAFNLGIRSKFDRCDFCGKWAVVHRASLGELRAAEKAELEAALTTAPRLKTDADLFKELLDKSRYVDDI